MIIQGLIVAHAALGGVALLAGFTALGTRKGESLHILSGRVFFTALLLSAALALAVAILPGHENPFLFAIGVFTMYLILIGYRTVRHKGTAASLLPDQVISVTMLLTGLGMLVYPVLSSGSFNIVLGVFGAIGVSLAIRDLRNYRDPAKLRKHWQMIHLGNMIGGLIAATTAFIVVNGFIPGLWGWLSPTVAGVALIIYWRRRLART